MIYNEKALENNKRSLKIRDQLQIMINSPKVENNKGCNKT